MSTYRDALTRAVDAAATPGRSIIDVLAGDSVCHCGRPGAKPRKWNTPKGVARGYFCDDCEVALDLARRHLVDGLVTRAWQTLERVAS